MIRIMNLKKDARIFERNDHPDYHKYLQKIYKEMKEKYIEYGYQENDEENNLNFNNIPNNNNLNYYNNTNNDNINNVFNPQEPEINIRVYLNQFDFQNNREQLARNMTTDNTNDKNEVKKKGFDASKNIRKFKNSVRKINKLKKLYKEIDEETKEDLKMNKKCTCGTCGVFILFVAFFIALTTDFLLPIVLNPEDDFTKSVDEVHTNFSLVEFIAFIILVYPFSVIASSYTLIMIYSTKRKEYISGDYLYDKQINDNISLLKTVQIICGYSFSILYCNIYFWRTVDTHGHYGKPKFYETTFIPDYSLKQGITIFMIAKIIVIVSSIFGSYYFSSCDTCKKCKKCKILNIYQNDLGEFDRSDNNSNYVYQIKLNKLYVEKGLAVSYLLRE